MTAITIMLVSRRLKWISVCERSNPISSVVGVTPFVRAKALPERVEAPAGLERALPGCAPEARVPEVMSLPLLE
jgi:hypothetical protein